MTETEKIITAFRKYDPWVVKILATFPQKMDRFQIDNKVLFRILNQYAKGSHFVKVACLLDGETSIADLMNELRMSEFEVLQQILRLYSKKYLEAFQVADENELIDTFMPSLKAFLGKLVGPIAPVVMQDAFSKLEITPEQLVYKQIRELIQHISNQLDSADAIKLKHWVIDYRDGLILSEKPKKTQEQKVAGSKKMQPLIQNFKSRLEALIGPIADIVIQDAFTKLGVQEDLITHKQIPEWVSMVAQQLEPNDAAKIKSWVQEL
ncbi:MAG: hypothetical protein DRH93_17360 [Deltaproteobacteria bacterium]|nr:MAG: hypothetical protein DRH93_17360 [Deltaproteobacteria bacterium]